MDKQNDKQRTNKLGAGISQPFSSKTASTSAPTVTREEVDIDGDDGAQGHGSSGGSVAEGSGTISVEPLGAVQLNGTAYAMDTCTSQVSTNTNTNTTTQYCQH
jgi:hypothetical protein